MSWEEPTLDEFEQEVTAAYECDYRSSSEERLFEMLVRYLRAEQKRRAALEAKP